MEAFRLFLFLSLLEYFVGGETVDIMNPTERCIATATQIGNCHVCVCKTDGVYHCRGLKCNANQSTTDPSLPECAVGHTYRIDTFFCTCDSTGHWRAERCMRRFNQMRPRTNNFVLRISTNIECTPNHFYISECNVCVCDRGGYINFASCTNRICPEKSKLDKCNPGDFIKTKDELCACSDINYFIDRLCIKLNGEPIQEVDANALDLINGLGSFWADLRIRCKPFYTYTIDCSHCYCNEYGEIYRCDYKSCDRRFIDNESLRVSKPLLLFKSLPKLDSPYDVCTPGVKYRYKCNTCYCTDKREAICTSMICLEDIKFSIKDLRLRRKKRNIT